VLRGGRIAKIIHDRLPGRDESQHHVFRRPVRVDRYGDHRAGPGLGACDTAGVALLANQEFCPQIYRVYTIWAKNFYAIILPSFLLVGSFGDAFPSDEIRLVLMRNPTVTGIIMLSRPYDIITTLDGYNLYASAAIHIHSDTNSCQVALFLSSVRARVLQVSRTMC
jgi:hypothetical protein